jgi:transcription antitermination factor NusA-like protein
MTVIDMQTMRYLNLFNKVSHVKTTRCFVYNNTILFAVPSAMMRQAIGPEARNVHIIQETLGKRVKIIAEAQGPRDVEKFVRSVVDPVSFKSLSVEGDEAVINAGGQYKAALIGRNKARLDELALIIQNVFGKQLKIV